MFFAYLTLISALLLAAVAGVFSVAGMMAIFAGNPLAGMAVGVVIELGKLMAVSWLYRYWDDRAWFRHLMAIATVVAMLVTSIGVFGYLSKAHTDQGKDVPNNVAKIQVIDEKINRYQVSIDSKKSSIQNSEKSLKNLDEQIAVLISHNRISDEKNGSRVVTKEQKPERDRLTNEISEAEKIIDSYQEKISTLREEKLQLGNVVRNFEVEIGPVKNVARILYNDPENNMDKAINIVICMIMAVLDPMAIMLLMGYNHIMLRKKDNTPPKDGSPGFFKKIHDGLEKTMDKVKDAKIADLNNSVQSTSHTEDAQPESTLDTVSDETPATTKVKSEVGTRVPVRHDVVNGVMTPIHPQMNEKDRIAMLKDKINSPPKSEWINNITTKRN